MSGRKNVILPYKFIDANALNGSFVSKEINVQYLDNIGLQLAVVTNANTGLFTIEASIDGDTWDTIKLSPVIPALAGANTTITVNLNQLPFNLIRVVFTAGVGTNGTVTGYITAKEL